VAAQLGNIPVESDDQVTPGHLLVVLGADFNPATVPAPVDDAPVRPSTAPPPSAPITAAGVPCID
jgi:hypothetical protein